MAHTRIKICGVTRPEDARAAARHGADAIGLVFYPPSSRSLDLEGARAIIEALPPFVTPVALFLDPEAALVQRVVESVRPELLQFHGDESGDFCRSFGHAYIKAVGMGSSVSWTRLGEAYGDARGLLVDSHQPGAAGGTGETFAWDRLPTAPPRPLILAGGLTSANVSEAVSTVRPAAVDVSSGVESARGIKDEARIAEFIEEVRRGDRSQD